MAVRMCEALLGQSSASYLSRTFFPHAPESPTILENFRIFEGLPDFSLPQPAQGHGDASNSSNLHEERLCEKLPANSIYREVSVLLTVWTSASAMLQEVKAGGAHSLWLPKSPCTASFTRLRSHAPALPSPRAVRLRQPFVRGDQARSNILAGVVNAAAAVPHLALAHASSFDTYFSSGPEPRKASPAIFPSAHD